MADFSGATLASLRLRLKGGGRASAEHLCRELRINLGKLRRHHFAHKGERFGRGRRRLRHVGGLVPGALMKSTFGTSVRRECSVRNRMTFGTT